MAKTAPKIAAPATPVQERAPGRQFGNVTELAASIPLLTGNPHAREGAKDAGRDMIQMIASAWANQPAFAGFADDRAEQYEAQSFSYILGSVLGGLASNYTRAVGVADDAALKMGQHMQSEEHDRAGVSGFASKGEQLMDRAMIADARAAFVGHLIEGAAEAYEEVTGAEWKPYIRPGAATSTAAAQLGGAAKDRMAAFLAARSGAAPAAKPAPKKRAPAAKPAAK